MNLYSFTHGIQVGSYGSDGGVPLGTLALSGNTLFGTCNVGGTSGDGTVFSLSIKPQLNIVHSGSTNVLSWPTNYAGFAYSGFTLQSTTNLASPVWTTNFPAPVVLNGQFTVTNPIPGTQTVFQVELVAAVRAPKHLSLDITPMSE